MFRTCILHLVLLVVLCCRISAAERCRVPGVCNGTPTWMTVATNKEKVPSASSEECEKMAQALEDRLKDLDREETELRERLTEYMSLKPQSQTTKGTTEKEVIIRDKVETTSTSVPELTTETTSVITTLAETSVHTTEIQTTTAAVDTTEQHTTVADSTTTVAPSTTSTADCVMNWQIPTNFHYVGCYKEETPWTGNRVIPGVEGSYPTVSDYYRTRSNAMEKCARIAFCLGYQVFALQHGGWCATSHNAHLVYARYGVSNACRPDGEGASATNAVYRITGN